MYQNRTCGFGPSLDVSIAASIAGAHVRVGFQYEDKSNLCPDVSAP
jgi:hypothetical protein